MRFRLLGPLEVLDDAGQPVALGGRKQRSVLAMLALSVNRVVPADRLISGVWGDDATDRASATLQVYVSTLRKQLRDAAPTTDQGPAITGRRPGYVLELPPDALDLTEFERLTAAGRSALQDGRPDAAAAALHQAASLWRGDALSDLRGEPFAVTEVVRLDQARLGATEDRIEADLALALHARLVPELEQLVAHYPLRERLWGQLIVALYRSDRQADALAAYGRARAMLADELGIDPGPALRDLERAVLAQELDVAAPPARVAPDMPQPVRLPRPASGLVGRQDDLHRLAALLADPDDRLVTITGPGGSGKTRLALEAARGVAQVFAGGSYFADLAAIADPQLVLPTIAVTFGARQSALDLVPAISELVGDREVLLLLDNVEHVLAAAPDIAALLRQTPQLHVLATSRSALRISGEVEFRLDGLPVPAPNADSASAGSTDAVRLFVARARAFRPDFALQPANADVIADICRRLGGMPLALELAAARLRTLSLETIRSRLDDALGLLTAGRRDAPARQRTLRDTIAWSVDLLDDESRRALNALCSFAGDFDLTAALAVGDDATEQSIESLLDSSLLAAGQSDDEPRFRVLEPVRQFVAHTLSEDERAAVAARHVDYFAALAQDSGRAIHGPDGPAALTRIAADYSNVIAAMAAALSLGQIDVAAGIGCALTPFWSARGWAADGRVRLAEVLDAAPAPATRAMIQAAAGRLAYEQNDPAEATASLSAALDSGLLDPSEAALSRCFLAAVALGTRDVDAARTAAQDALENAERVGSYLPRAVALAVRAIAATMSGDFATEQALYEQRLALARAHGDLIRVADTLTTLGEIAFDEQDLVTADRRVREGFAIADRYSRRESRDALILLARIAIADRDVDRAEAFLDEAVQRAADIGQPAALALGLRVAGACAALRGDDQRAAQLFGAGQALQPASVPVNAALERDVAHWRGVSRERLTAPVFDRWHAAGAELTRRAAVDLALRAGVAATSAAGWS